MILVHRANYLQAFHLSRGILALRLYSGGPRTQPRKKHKLSNKLKAKHKEQTFFRYGNYEGLKKNSFATTAKATRLIDNITSFEELKLLPVVRDAVKSVIESESLLMQRTGNGVSNITPSPIQILAIKRLSHTLMDQKQHVFAIAADTGSGKTMAYLAPLLDFLIRQKIEKPEIWSSSIRSKAGIRSIILVPTHELIEQVYSTVLKVEENLSLHTFKWDIHTKYSEVLDAIKDRIDMLVTTPSKLLTLFKIRMITHPESFLSMVQYVAVDEADTLMDHSWIAETRQVINRCPNLSHLIFCSATIPNEFNKTLSKLYPSFTPIVTPRLHKLPKKLDFKIVDSTLNPFKGSKIKTLAQILYAVAHSETEPGLEKRTIVFVNKKSDVEKIVQVLKSEYGHEHVFGLTGSDTVEKRLETIRDFLQPPKRLEELPASVANESTEFQEPLHIPESNITLTKHERAKGNKPFIKVLVTTDLLARGLNFQAVKNVILYDVPSTPVDLVHRVGRTARMRQNGRIFMITDKSTKSWARALPKIAKKSITLS
ncbi:hypothetical protein KAFR_0K02330 [Kazachstania africana CBS 2517]|uniref:RNA helicase n=1 Tax=Kazachstania africana (strain ATCC 22294 / BCRC 22015 / CBS 2517 / CECT 1963 / NBRC 1671 / NRRL Y-8276) TaxID=1071382 RepID=H2B1T8_KAZAF|nr:hypothetical protein KAFR_0K02330 [Kazachstania africana CBS 2517]CCF60588.1 hypothetical protein KAFR_0K02330 [Kazachstania africana CBS 2517]